MKIGLARGLLVEFVRALLPGPMDSFLEEYREILEELAQKFAKNFDKGRDVRKYLDETLHYIDDLNKYLKKKKGGKIPYSKVFHFAKKDERILDFKFETGALEKTEKNKDPGMAGFESSGKKTLDQVFFDDGIYSFIYKKGKRSFFFSMDSGRLAVRYDRTLLTYSQYRSDCKVRGKKYIQKVTIFKFLREQESLTEDMTAFMNHYRALRRKLKKKK